MLVQQEGGAVQPDRGLARARAALHDEAAIERRADDRVLLALDRGDDVAHLPGAGPPELGEHRVGHAARSGERVRIVEVLVEDVLQVGAGEHEPAPQAQAERIGERRPVERRRDVGPPVDDDGRAVAVLDVAAPDVPTVAFRSRRCGRSRARRPSPRGTRAAAAVATSPLPRPPRSPRARPRGRCGPRSAAASRRGTAPRTANGRARAPRPGGAWRRKYRCPSGIGAHFPLLLHGV